MNIKRISAKVVILGFIFLFLVGCVSGGKTYTALGTVVDSEGNGIGDVSLVFEGFGLAKTNAEGKWVKSGLNGNVKVILEKEGLWFATYTISEASSNIEFIGYTSIDSIQKAINAAQDGDIITVPPGVYYENIDFKGKNITLTSIDPKDPDLVAATIIDGGGNGAVVCIDDAETNAVLTGFTITNGTGFLGYIYSGGGIYVNNSAATISHNIIEKNKADYGGGIFLNGCYTSIIEANTIRDNIAVSNGAGLYAGDGQHIISNNTISNNHAYLLGGGGVTLHNGHKILKNNIISNNVAPEGGGILVSLDYNAPDDRYNTITGNYVENNTARNGGGLCAKSVVDFQVITDNVFRSNEAIDNGGGLYFEHINTTIVSNNLVASNKAALGGGLYLRDSVIILVKNEFNANEAFIGPAFWKGSNSTLIGNDGNSLSATNDDNEYIDNYPDDPVQY